MELAQRVQQISISPTVAVLMEAERYKARGIDIVDFGPGEPDFPTPENIKQAAIRALQENRTKYTSTAGIMPLRQAICDWHAREFGSGYQPAECIVCVGGKHAIFNAINCLVNSGDEVVIPAPYWVSYPDIVKYAGGNPVYLKTKTEEGFCPRAEGLERILSARTRMVIINSPSNPTGAVVPPEEFARILQLCEERKVWLLSDECYSHFIYGGVKPFSVASMPQGKSHVIIVGSLSKTFAMTGWRVGYALAPAPLVEAMIKLQSQCTSNPTSISQYAALEALKGPKDSVVNMLAEYSRRRNRILRGLWAIQGVSCAEPQGAFYVFPDVSQSRWGQSHSGGESGACDTARLARELLEGEHLAVVPGDAFGAPGFLRLSYATSLESIEEGLRRLAHFLSNGEPAS